MNNNARGNPGAFKGKIMKYVKQAVLSRITTVEKMLEAFEQQKEMLLKNIDEYKNELAELNNYFDNNPIFEG